MKSIIIVTLALPLLAGCGAFLKAPSPAAASRPAAPAEGSAARDSTSDKIQLKPTAALDAARQLERDEVKPETRAGDADFRHSQTQALAGDRMAAMRVARMYAAGTNGVPRDERRMVLWLKHASMLDHASASYELYLYYLARGRDRDALLYERRALRQGYILPVRLDNKRG